MGVFIAISLCKKVEEVEEVEKGVEKVEKVGAYGTEFLMIFIAHVHLMLSIVRYYLHMACPDTLDSINGRV